MTYEYDWDLVEQSQDVNREVEYTPEEEQRWEAMIERMAFERDHSVRMLG